MKEPRIPPIPVPAGFVEEAIAKYYLGPKAQWIGGRNPGYDFRCGNRKIDAKSGVRQQRRLRVNAAPVETIGIRLNRGLEGLKGQDVDEIIVVVHDRNTPLEHNLVSDEDSGYLHLSIRFESAEVYRIPVHDMPKVFQRPFTAQGTRYASTANVDAPVTKLQAYRAAPIGL